MATHCSGVSVKMVDDPDEIGAFSPPNQQRDQLAADTSDEIDFVAPPPKDLECSLCLQVLKDPTLTSCGHHFCRACIDRVIAKNHVCPLCKEKGFQTMLDRATDRKILALRVRCKMKFCGCQWEGEFGDLERHLDVRKGDCGFVQVECEFGCTAKLLRGDMPQHMEESTHKHLILLAMPQGGSESERRLQEKRAELLQQQLLRREEKMKQELMTVKIQQREGETKKELIKMKQEQTTLAETLHTQLQEKEKRISELQQRVESLERTRSLEKQAPVVKLHSPELTNEQYIQNDHSSYVANIHILAAIPRSQPLPPAFIPPPVITMTDFEKHKRDGDQWFSPPFYSHIGGYKTCIRIDANGCLDGKGTHVSVVVSMMQGEYDDHLRWPFRGDITVQLLNQRRDGGHWEGTIHIDDRVDDEVAGRVVGQERSSSGKGFAKFIAHTALGYNADKNTEYLKNDCLKFQVTNIVVKSVK